VNALSEAASSFQDFGEQCGEGNASAGIHERQAKLAVMREKVMVNMISTNV
jgi:hypothetical protein